MRAILVSLLGLLAGGAGQFLPNSWRTGDRNRGRL